MFYIILFQKQYLIKTIIKQTIFIMLVVRNSVFWREMTRFGNYLTRKLTNFSKDFVNSISLPLSSAEQFGANKRLSLRQRHGWERQKVTKKETKGWGWPRPRENWRVSLFYIVSGMFYKDCEIPFDPFERVRMYVHRNVRITLTVNLWLMKLSLTSLIDNLVLDNFDNNLPLEYIPHYNKRKC